VSPTVSAFAALTPTIAPATHTNSYALGDRDVLLVEPATPYEDEQKEWLAWARSLASQGRTAAAIVLTHHHPDHVGGVDVLARELGLPVWAHRETRARLDDPRRVDRALEDGELLALDGPIPTAWRVLHTPGHAPGHVCLHEPRTGAVVVGDMVASVGTILIAPGDGDMKVYLEQLARLERLGARVALPAHGDPIDDPSRLFRHYILHRLAREAKVLASVGAAGDGGAADDELVPVAYSDTPPLLWPIAALSMRAHLDKLAQDGRVEHRDGRWRLAPAA